MATNSDDTAVTESNVSSFSDPIEPTGDGRITLVTRFPIGEYVAKDGKTRVTSKGTNMSRDEADKILKEAPESVRELKKESN